MKAKEFQDVMQEPLSRIRDLLREGKRTEGLALRISGISAGVSVVAVLISGLIAWKSLELSESTYKNQFRPYVSYKFHGTDNNNMSFVTFTNTGIVPANNVRMHVHCVVHGKKDTLITKNVGLVLPDDSVVLPLHNKNEIVRNEFEYGTFGMVTLEFIVEYDGLHTKGHTTSLIYKCKITFEGSVNSYERSGGNAT